MKREFVDGFEKVAKDRLGVLKTRFNGGGDPSALDRKESENRRLQYGKMTKDQRSRNMKKAIERKRFVEKLFTEH